MRERDGQTHLKLLPQDAEAFVLAEHAVAAWEWHEAKDALAHLPQILWADSADRNAGSAAPGEAWITPHLDQFMQELTEPMSVREILRLMERELDAPSV